MPWRLGRPTLYSGFDELSANGETTYENASTFSGQSFFRHTAADDALIYILCPRGEETWKLTLTYDHKATWEPQQDATYQKAADRLSIASS